MEMDGKNMRRESERIWRTVNEMHLEEKERAKCVSHQLTKEMHGVDAGEWE